MFSIQKLNQNFIQNEIERERPLKLVKKKIKKQRKQRSHAILLTILHLSLCLSLSLFLNFQIYRNITKVVQSSHILYTVFLSPLLLTYFINIFIKINKLVLKNYYQLKSTLYLGFPGGASSKEPTCQCMKCKRYGFDSWIRKDSLEEIMAIHFSMDSGIPWIVEPGGLCFIGLQRVGHD